METLVEINTFSKYFSLNKKHPISYLKGDRNKVLEFNDGIFRNDRKSSAKNDGKTDGKNERKISGNKVDNGMGNVKSNIKDTINNGSNVASIENNKEKLNAVENKIMDNNIEKIAADKKDKIVIDKVEDKVVENKVQEEDLAPKFKYTITTNEKSIIKFDKPCKLPLLIGIYYYKRTTVKNFNIILHLHLHFN